MRKMSVIMLTITLLILTFTQLAVAQNDWIENRVTNKTSETIYVVFSTWRVAKGAVTATGYRSVGYYTIAPGDSEKFWAYQDNPLYLLIEGNGEALKPRQNTPTVSSWIFASNRRDFTFNIVTPSVGGTTRADIKFMSVNSDQSVKLVNKDGFIKYRNGSQISVTNAWVQVTPPDPPEIEVDIPDPTDIPPGPPEIEVDIPDPTDIPPGPPEIEVDIPDPNRRRVILKTGDPFLHENIPIEDIRIDVPITRAEMENLTVLNSYLLQVPPHLRGVLPPEILQQLATAGFTGADNLIIRDLTGLEFAVNLKMLTLTGNEISDVSPLANLRNLTYLNLADNEISDVSPLANLRNLEILDLTDNPIADVTPLVGLRSGGTEIRGVTFDTLVEIPDPNLRRAIAGVLNKPANTPITQEDMKKLTGAFRASNKSIADLTGLEFAVNLKTLILSGNNISDISPLRDLTHLRTLVLSENQITDIAPLRHFRADLITLGIDGNPISDISPLEDLPILKTLLLSKNQISDISPLPNFKSLETLRLIDDTGGFENLRGQELAMWLEQGTGPHGGSTDKPPVIAGGSQDYTLHAFLKHEGEIHAVAFSPDGQTLASAGHGVNDGHGRVLLWDPHTEELKKTISAESIMPIRNPVTGHLLPSIVRSIAFRPNGEMVVDDLAVAVSSTGQVAKAVHTPRNHHADRDAENYIKVTPGGYLEGHTSIIRTLAFSPDGRTLASGSSDNTVRVWDTQTLQPKFMIQYERQVWAVAFSPDGQMLATGGHPDYDGYGVDLWNPNTQQRITTLEARVGQIEGLAFSPDGQTLVVATGSSQTEAIHLWDLQTKQRIENFPAKDFYVRKVAISPDGEMIAAAVYGLVGSIYAGSPGVALWKRAGLPIGNQETKAPASISTDFDVPQRPQIIYKLSQPFSKLYTLTAVVKNASGQGLPNVQVEVEMIGDSIFGLVTTGFGVETTSKWTNDKGEIKIPFDTVHGVLPGQHDVRFKVTARDRITGTELEKTATVNIEIAKPHSIRSVSFGDPHRLALRSVYIEAFEVTSSDGTKLENFWTEVRLAGHSRKGTTDKLGIVRHAIFLESTGAQKMLGTHDVEVRVLAGPNREQVVLKKTFPHWVTIYKDRRPIRDCTTPPIPIEAVGGDLKAFVFKNIKWHPEDTVAAESGTIILTFRFINGDSELHSLVKSVAPQWSDYANVKFNFLPSDDKTSPVDCPIEFLPAEKELGIKGIVWRDPDDWKDLEMELYGFPGWLQYLEDLRSNPLYTSGNPDVMKNYKIERAKLSGLILHEFGHVLGLEHEHSSPTLKTKDQAEQKRIFGKVLETPFKWNIQALKDAGKDVTQFTLNRSKGAGLGDLRTPFDPKSIMVYIIHGDWNTAGFSTVGTVELSEQDKKFIGREDVYGLPKPVIKLAGKIQCEGDIYNKEGGFLGFGKKWVAHEFNFSKSVTFFFSSGEQPVKTSYYMTKGMYFRLYVGAARRFDVMGWSDVSIAMVGDMATKRSGLPYAIDCGRFEFGWEEMTGSGFEVISAPHHDGGGFSIQSNTKDCYEEAMGLKLPYDHFLDPNINKHPDFIEVEFQLKASRFKPSKSEPDLPDISGSAAPSIVITDNEPMIPQITTLLPNYPNPFNPETWIPYHLAKSSQVTLTIYAIDGKVVRRLDLGHQAAGYYHSRPRAAYWDGRNNVGERVASGLYFYTLMTDDFAATRKLLILK